MSESLLNKTTKKLLEEFGAGNPTPGSGSAAALQALLSANLCLTVIKITLEKAKTFKKYSTVTSDLKQFQNEIEIEVYPDLVSAFENDSIVFAEVIDLRNAAKNESDPYKKLKLERQSQEKLRIATAFPLKISNHSLRLTEIAEFLFEHGFQSATGDSSVALNAATAAISGCISIIYLNLGSLGYDVWTAEVLAKAKKLENRREEIEKKQKSSYEKSKQTMNLKSLIAELELIKPLSKAGFIRLTDKEIEQKAARVQSILWKHPELFWSENRPQSRIECLKPEVVLKKLKYEINEELVIEPGESGNVIGEIDMVNRKISIALNYPTPMRKFTMAHELGHALLHLQPVLHREIPNHGTLDNHLGPMEWQANQFAKHFLMPAFEVKRVFLEIFGTEKLILNLDVVFALTGHNDINTFKKKYRNLRSFSILIAGTKMFFTPTDSIAERFGVSIETMAIRLEELGLVQY